MQTSRERLAVVTGASSGIGEAFARRLARDGYDLVLVARRKQILDELAGELTAAHNVSIEVVAADLSEDVDLALLAERIRSFKALAMLINNAGFQSPVKFIDSDLETQIAMVRVHDIATMILTKAALETMRALGHGTIINVSSMSAFLPTPYNATYNATKAFLVGLTEGIHQELLLADEKGIKLQVLCPGSTHTGFHQLANIDKASLPKRLWMSANEVVDESLAHLDAGRVVLIPGYKNRMLSSFMHFVPHRVKYMMMRMSER
jgi:uncharacterized protein